jgi:hypothetical protein
MIKRNYYSVRGKILPDQVNFEVLKRLFSVFYNKLNSEGYLKYFGIDCEDGYSPGELGLEIHAMIL